MATKKTPVEPKRYPMTRDEIEGMNAMADSMDLKEAAKKAKAAAPAPKPTPDSEIPSEAREVMRQKAKDAAYESGEKERKKSMGTPFAKGGVTRADGCITKGRTKGRFV